MERVDREFFESLFRSFETEMRREFAEVRRELGDLKAQMEQLNTRMNRIGGLVNGGARAIAKLAEWSECTDVTTADLPHRVSDIDQRLRKLEGKKD